VINGAKSSGSVRPLAGSGTGLAVKMINARAAAVAIRPPSVSERIRDENRFFMRIVLQHRHCDRVKDRTERG
jgi:hypothetical protein